MSDKIHRAVTALADTGDARPVLALAKGRLAGGDPEFLAELGIAITQHLRGRHGGTVATAAGVFDRLLRMLALTPGRDNTRQAARLAVAWGAVDRRRVRYAASLLAHGQPARELASVFTGDGALAGGTGTGVLEDLRACLVHELVLRDGAVGELPGIAEWTVSPEWREHPLAWLPLSLAAIERDPQLPTYHFEGSSGSLPYGDVTGLPATSPDPAGNVPAATETTTAPVAAAIGAAVANWDEESNGRVEARTFELATPIGLDAVANTLSTLDIECLNEPEPDRFSEVIRCPPDQVWRPLFVAAAQGGAYSSGCYGAYGRLAAWRSIAGLCGAPSEATAADVERRAGECEWYAIPAATAWFYRVVWDFGFAAVTPERRRLAILAATDTD